MAFDTVETPFGKAEQVLGGSASFFAVAASFFAPVNLVGVVGNDFGEKSWPPSRAGPSTRGPRADGRGQTFHWQGKYSYDLNSRDTVRTELNVFEFFKPKIPANYRASQHVFLGNIDPVLQRDVLEQVERPQLVACDTMNFWISGKPRELRETLARVDVLLINDAESARALGGVEHREGGAGHPCHGADARSSSRRASTGCVMFAESGSFAAPAYPLEEVFDPTGAGDTFAGGFLGYLASAPRVDEETLRRAVIMGSTLASFCVEAFSLDRLLTLTRPEIDERFRLFKGLTNFESI